MVGIVVGVRLARGNAEAGRGTYHRFVDLLPGSLRPHEGLVVEAGCEERRGEIVEPADIESERRPAVLRPGLHAVIDFLHGCPDVRCPPHRIAADIHQRIGFFRSGRQHAARPVVLERPPGQMDAVGQQGRSQRIAFHSRQDLVVEFETQGFRRRQPALALDPVRAAHCAAPLTVRTPSSPRSTSTRDSPAL
jgi:hypothetical protein